MHTTRGGKRSEKRKAKNKKQLQRAAFVCVYNGIMSLKLRAEIGGIKIKASKSKQTGLKHRNAERDGWSECNVTDKTATKWKKSNGSNIVSSLCTKTSQPFQMLKQIYVCSPPLCQTSREPPFRVGKPSCSSHIGASSPNWKTHSTNEICVIPAAQRRREGSSTQLNSTRLVSVFLLFHFLFFYFCCFVVCRLLVLRNVCCQSVCCCCRRSGRDAAFWDSCTVCYSYTLHQVGTTLIRP